MSALVVVDESAKSVELVRASSAAELVAERGTTVFVSENSKVSEPVILHRLDDSVMAAVGALGVSVGPEIRTLSPV